MREQTKTQAGTRVVPLYRRQRVLLAHRYRRLDPRLTTPDSFVFCNTQGGPVHPGAFAEREWWPALRTAGLEGRFRLHDLRHHAVTALDEQGMGGRLRTERSSATPTERLTNGIYTHVRRERVSRAAGAFDPLRGVKLDG